MKAKGLSMKFDQVLILFKLHPLCININAQQQQSKSTHIYKAWIALVGVPRARGWAKIISQTELILHPQSNRLLLRTKYEKKNIKLLLMTTTQKTN